VKGKASGDEMCTEIHREMEGTTLRLRYTSRYKTKRLGREMKGTSLEGENRERLLTERQIQKCMGNLWMVRYRDR
jgi:hypothetical protein